MPVGDEIKSWDVAQTLDFIEGKLSRDAKILDLGAFCSEVPVALARMGFVNVHGVDLNPKVLNMPYPEQINYCVGDFMNTPYPADSFEAITSISVIEHGYNPERLFFEIARILKTGGYFIASFDYWPEKIDTNRIRFFDMSWLIFSEHDISLMLNEAQRHGLNPAGNLYPKASGRPINCMNLNYTFGWVVLRKDD